MTDTFLEELIKYKLEELHPNFDALHIERRMYETCKEDFINFFTTKKMMTIEEFRNYFYKHLVETGHKCKEEIFAFICLWYATYQKRVKLLLTEEKIHNKEFNQIQMLERRGSKKIPHKLMDILKEPIIEALIKHGEICFTDTVAEQYIKRCVAKKTHSIKSLEGQIKIVNDVMNHVNIKSKLSGYTVFLRLGNLLHNHNYNLGDKNSRSEDKEEA